MSPSDHQPPWPEGSGIHATDAELAAAEQRLRELSPDQVVPLRSEWIETMVAEAVAARAPVATDELSPTQRPSLPWLRRWVAAAVAVVGMQGFAAAMTVTGVGVVTAAVVMWSGANSTATLSLTEAVEILMRQDQAENARASALGRVVMCTRGVVDALQTIRAESGDSSLVESADRGLARLVGLLRGEVVETTSPSSGFMASLVSLTDRHGDVEATRQHMATCLDDVAAGVVAMHAMPGCNASLAASRDHLVRRLLDQARR